MLEEAKQSHRQIQVLSLLLGSKTEKEIASLLGVTRNTVHSYVKDLYRRHQVHSRREIVHLLAADHTRRSRLEDLARAIEAQPPTSVNDIRIVLILPRRIVEQLQARHGAVRAFLTRLALAEAARLV